MTPEERLARIRKLVAGLESGELEALIANLKSDIVEEQRRRDWIGALLSEREGHERQGDAKRVRQIDEQLARYGHAPVKAELKAARGPAR
jgi:hypothetical protein